MDNEIKIITEFSPEFILQHEKGPEGNYIHEQAKRLIDLREEGIKEALKKLGYIDPATTKEIKDTLILVDCNHMHAVDGFNKIYDIFKETLYDKESS
jgi:hypothetical protein